MPIPKRGRLIDQAPTVALYTYEIKRRTLAAREGHPVFGAGHVRTPGDAHRALVPLFEDVMDEQEALVILALDSRHRAFGYREVARGANNAVNVVPRELFRAALLLGASAFIMAHNHPSGDPTPSQQDADLTSRIRAAGELNGIPMLDHLVVTSGEGFFSFNEGRVYRPSTQGGDP